MTESDDDALDRASAPPPAIDLSALAASAADAPPSVFGVPNHQASAEPSHTARILSSVGARRGKGGKEETAKRTATRQRTRRKAPPSYRRDMFVEPLEAMYGYLGMALLPFDPTCGQAVLQSAHECAVSLDRLAETNGGVRRVLWSITQTSALGIVVAAHAPILLAVTMHHLPAMKNAFGAFNQPAAAESGEPFAGRYAYADETPPPATSPPVNPNAPTYVNPNASVPVA